MQWTIRASEKFRQNGTGANFLAAEGKNVLIIYRNLSRIMAFDE